MSNAENAFNQTINDNYSNFGQAFIAGVELPAKILVGGASDIAGYTIQSFSGTIQQGAGEIGDALNQIFGGSTILYIGAAVIILIILVK